MKTKLKQFTLLFAVLLCTVACNAIDAISEVEEGTTNTSGVSFTAQMNAPATKASDTAFESGDKISVTAYSADGYIYQSNVEYSYLSNTFTAISPIEYSDLNSELEFRALYPSIEMATDKSAIFSVYADQSSGSNYTLSDLMFGYAAFTSAEFVQLTFDHLLTKIVVNITSSDVDMAGASVALTAVAGVEYDLSTFVSSAVSDAQTITMASNGINSYKAIVVPQTISNTAPFGVISTASGDYGFYISATTTLLGSSQYTINATIENNEITFDSPIISEWEEGVFSEEVDERAILEQIYYATGGDEWTTSTNWCTDAPLSEWYGVTIDDEMGCVTELDLSSNNLVGDLNANGLNNLTHLRCSYNSLTTLEVGTLTNLTWLSCAYNSLTTLEVGALTNLTLLSCSYNSLTTLEVGALTNLTTLVCEYNSLTTLEVGTLTNLTWLSCACNSLTILEVGALTNLTTLGCESNSLTTLEVGALTNLTYLHCGNNFLTTLDVGRLTNLEFLYCAINQLSTLDVSTLTKLTSLYCFNNELTTLDVSALTGLTNLQCTSNYLTTIYLYSTPAIFLYTSWGDYNTSLYAEPIYKGGYQYPEFIYVQ